MRNTGVSIVYNNTSARLDWNDLETDNQWFGERSGQIPAGQSSKIAVVAPWCSNSHDIITKSIGFSDDSANVRFYVFQSAIDGQLYYVPSSTGEASLWASKVWCGEGPSSYVNLTIRYSGKHFQVTASAVA